MDEKQNQRLAFAHLVVLFHTLAMQQLGKIKNPMTDTIDRNLEAAQESIDILDMLNEKTKGNLNADEERLLSNTLQELKLNFVEEKNKPEPTSKTQEKT